MVIPFPYKIISGGQTGADRAGLDFAIEAGLDHGGYCPRGRRSEDGAIPEHYQLIETTDWKYRSRTILNVRESNATVIFNAGPGLSAGSGLTAQAAKSEGRACLILKDFMPDAKWADFHAAKIVEFLALHRPAVLNIAGNREESVRGLSEYVITVLHRARAMAKQGLQGNIEAPVPLSAALPLPAPKATGEQGFLSL